MDPELHGLGSEFPGVVDDGVDEGGADAAPPLRRFHGQLVELDDQRGAGESGLGTLARHGEGIADRRPGG